MGGLGNGDTDSHGIEMKGEDWASFEDLHLCFAEFH